MYNIYMKVTSTETIHFPSLNWGIVAGEVKELPDNTAAQVAILAHYAISEVKGGDVKKKAEKPEQN